MALKEETALVEELIAYAEQKAGSQPATTFRFLKKNLDAVLGGYFRDHPGARLFLPEEKDVRNPVILVWTFIVGRIESFCRESGGFDRNYCDVILTRVRDGIATKF